MHISRHNMEFNVDGTLYLLNPLSGAFNRIDSPELKEQWKQLSQGAELPENDAFVSKLVKGGFVYRDEDEERIQYNRVKAIADAFYQRTLRCHIIMSYDCNLSCVYCFEKSIARNGREMTEEMALKCLQTIESLAEDYEKVEIVLFGGEPLLYNEARVKLVQFILDFAGDKGWTVDVITNGVDLKHYANMLRDFGRIGQIQVTLDGPKELHDERKPANDGSGSFVSTEASIDVALKAGLPIVVRMNIDSQNLEHFAELADFFALKGWFDYPNFGAYFGMTYDFEGDYAYQMPPHKLLARVLDLRMQRPNVRRISIEAWESLQFVLYPYFKGEPRLPKFQFCSAQRGEHNFDSEGNLYFCADSVGRNGCVAGKYYPELAYSDMAENIRSNTVPGINTICAACPAQLCCGGGCWFRRYLSKDPKCSEMVYQVLETTVRYLHGHPEVFSENYLTAQKLEQAAV